MLKTYTRKRNQENKIIEDVHELCRLCLARADESVPIFGEGNSACAALPMRIMICVGHEITQEDCLPNTICTNCHQELERYYKFRKKCENSYRRLKAHYNATKYQEKIAETIENKIEDEQNNIQLQEYTINEEITADGVDKLVIVDVFNVEENVELNNPVMANGSIPEPNVNNEEKVEETTEIQVIEHVDDISPDISTFLNAILVELGILVKNEHGLVLQDQGVTCFQLETGDDDHVEFELVEEDSEDEESVRPPATITLPEVTSTSQALESENEEITKNGRARKNTSNADGNKTWCSHCGRTFASAAALRRHGTVHTGVRPFACGRCPRRFGQKAVLQRHMLVHEAVRPYACPLCPKSFTQRGALAAHSRAHAAPHARPLALHTCTHCDRVFLYASGLSRHMLTHSGYVFACGTCSRIFNDKSSLLRHARNTHACHNTTAAPEPTPT